MAVGFMAVAGSGADIEIRKAGMNDINELPVIDFNSAAYRTAPFATLAKIAQESKLARSSRGVEIMDYELCRSAIVDRRLGTGHPKLMHLLGLPESPALDYKRQSITFFNRGEKRRQLRQPLTKLMGPEGSERFRNDIRHIVHQIIDDIPTNTTVDLISALCDPTPSAVYCYWVGATSEDAAFVARTSHTVQQVHNRDPSKTDEIVEAFADLLTYVDERIAARRKNLGDDLISDLIRATDAGALTEDDLRNWVVKLAEANTDNSSHQIGIAVIELASRPDVWRRIGNNPTLVPAAIAEVMRYHPRSISTSREALVDYELDGIHIPKGTPVFANIGAAHWHPTYYPHPERFDMARKDPPSHLNFGGGIFSCIGRFAVTIEVEEVIAYLARKFPNLELNASRFSHSPMFTSVAELTATLR